MKISNIKPYLAEKCQVGLLFLNKKSIEFFSLFMYQTLYKMPLGKYIDIVVDKNLKSLRRMSIPCPKRAYISQFGKLQAEYTKLSGNVDVQVRINKQEEIRFIQYQIFFFSHALKMVIDSPNNTGSLEFLAKNGFEGSIEDIANAVTGELMGLKSNLDDLMATEEEAARKPKADVTREDYSKTILMASKNGYLMTYDTKVADFINALNLQKEEISRLNNKK